MNNYPGLRLRYWARTVLLLLPAVGLNCIIFGSHQPWSCESCAIHENVLFKLRVYESDDARLSGPFNNVYEGPVRRSRPLGAGSMRYVDENGPQYMQEGWPVGTRIEGYWAIAWRAIHNPSQPEGDVIVHWPNGFVVGGVWRRDRSDPPYVSNSRLVPGPGFVRFPDGEEFAGEWAQFKADWRLCYRGNCQSGRGASIDYRVRWYYIGEFQDGLPHGQGVRFEQRNADYMIFAGEFAQGDVSRGSFYCRRGDRSCLNLLANRRRSGALKMEWVDRFGFFQNVDAPSPAELDSAAGYLAELNASGDAK